MSDIYVTGDIHGNPERILDLELDKDDFIIVCGDFGMIWDREESRTEKRMIKTLEDQPYTILFVDGNHENFNRLNALPEEEWNGGMVHRVGNNVFHLMRGYVFDIAGKKIFTMGGARCHDIQDGVFKYPEDADKIDKLRYDPFAMFRVEGYSIWYDQEVPNDLERERGLDNLEKEHFQVDYIITHEAPENFVLRIYPNRKFLTNLGIEKDDNGFSEYLEKIEGITEYKHWYFGHHHMNRNFGDRHTCLYDDIRCL